MKKETENVIRIPEVFLETTLRLGADFLACGGPVTRLENQIVEAGLKFGYDTSVHATPTGLFISCYSPRDGQTFNRFRRINDFDIDLGYLRTTDKLLGQLANGTVNLSQAINHLDKIERMKKELSLSSHLMCLFTIGFSAGVLSKGELHHSVYGGLFTCLINIILLFATRFVGIHKIFGDFLSCFLALSISSIISYFYGVSALTLSIGTLAYIVPGLLMTTAISEVVDQNYLSGTIRLLKAFYTFLAMALAFYLVSDLASTFNWNMISEFSRENLNTNHPLWLKLIAVLFLILCFSIEFKAHKKSYFRILICGLLGSTTFYLSTQYAFVVLSSFLAAFVIGVVSFRLSRKFKHPSQIYSVPSILALVPGMLAFSGFGYGANSNTGAALNSVIQALLISLSIVFGLAAGRISRTSTPD